MSVYFLRSSFDIDIYRLDSDKALPPGSSDNMIEIHVIKANPNSIEYRCDLVFKNLKDGKDVHGITAPYSKKQLLNFANLLLRSGHISGLGWKSIEAITQEVESGEQNFLEKRIQELNKEIEEFDILLKDPILLDEDPDSPFILLVPCGHTLNPSRILQDEMNCSVCREKTTGLLINLIISQIAIAWQKVATHLSNVSTLLLDWLKTGQKISDPNLHSKIQLTTEHFNKSLQEMYQVLSSDGSDQLFKQPVILDPCGHTIEKPKEEKGACPSCNTAYTDFTVNFLVKSMISSLTITKENYARLLKALDKEKTKEKVNELQTQLLSMINAQPLENRSSTLHAFISQLQNDDIKAAPIPTAPSPQQRQIVHSGSANHNPWLKTTRFHTPYEEISLIYQTYPLSAEVMEAFRKYLDQVTYFEYVPKKIARSEWKLISSLLSERKKHGVLAPCKTIKEKIVMRRAYFFHFHYLSNGVDFVHLKQEYQHLSNLGIHIFGRDISDIDPKINEKRLRLERQLTDKFYEKGLAPPRQIALDYALNEVAWMDWIYWINDSKSSTKDVGNLLPFSGPFKRGFQWMLKQVLASQNKPSIDLSKGYPASIPKECYKEALEKFVICNLQHWGIIKNEARPC